MKMKGSSKHNMIFDSTETDKKGSFKEERKGSNGISTEKKNSMSYSSAKIKTETSRIYNSSEKIGNDRTLTKRSIDISESWSCLPAKKRLKLNNSFALCREEEKSVCKDEEDIDSTARCHELERDGIEEEARRNARVNDSLVAEHQALLRRKFIFNESSDEEPEEMDEEAINEPFDEAMKAAMEMNVIVADHQALLRRKLSVNEPTEEEQEELDEEDRLDELTKEAIKGAAEMNELVADHQAFLRRKFSLIKDESAEEEPEELDEEELDNEPIEEAIKQAREMDVLVAEHQALLRRTMGLLNNRIENKNIKDSDVPVGYDCVPRHWRSMTAEQKERANKLATLKIQTGNPAFLRVLNRSCLANKSYIVVPRSFSAKHLPEGTQTVVLRRPEFKEGTWSVRYYFRQAHQSIEGSAWVEFARENMLREGDICMFELVESAHEVTFVVHISRTASDAAFAI